MIYEISRKSPKPMYLIASKTSWRFIGISSCHKLRKTKNCITLMSFHMDFSEKPRPRLMNTLELRNTIIEFLAC